MDNVTIVFVLGAPGSGKGTQCEKIVEKYGWTHLSTGDLLRNEVLGETEMGQQVNEIMASGQMVPNELIFELLTNAMADSGSSRFLIDGFPRTMDQLMEFQTQIKPCDGALVFTVPEEVAVERLLARGATSGRVDDNEDTIRERMNVFWSESQQVIEFLADSVNLHEVDSAAPEEEVFAEVMPFMDAMDALAADREAGRAGDSGMASDADAASAVDEGPNGGRVGSELSEATVVYVLGNPGCDQDTQCELVRQRYKWTVIRPEDMLREEIDKETELGKQAAELLAVGQDVPSDLLVEMLAKALIAAPPVSRRFLLNGFPKHMAQLEAFETRVRPCDGVLILTMPEEVAVERLLASEEYESEEAVRDLLDAFRVETQPVIDILRDQNVQVADVDAAGDTEEVFAQVAAFIEGFGAPLDQAQAEDTQPPQQQQEEGQQQQEQGAEQEQQPPAGEDDAEASEGCWPGQSGYTEEQVRAAIRIQAAQRGYEGRRKMAAMREAKLAQLAADTKAAPATAAEGPAEVEREETVGGSSAFGEYTDEQVEAVVRIQAARRGYQDRKRVAAMRAGLRQQQQQLQAVGEKHKLAEVAAIAEGTAEATGAAEVEPEAAEAVADAQETSGLSEEEAILRIQAAGRGYLERKKVAAMKAEVRAQAALEAKEEEQVSAIRGMLVVCGPSGVGKGTLIGRLMSEHGDKFGFSVSHTTRGPRPGEQDGVHYHFTNRESMQRGVNAGLFLEYADVHGNMYGTSLEAVAAVGQSGRIAVLDIDVQGATKIKASRAASKARFVFVDPPSLEVLEARLRGRGTETEDKVQLRLSNARAEIDRSREPGFFDARLVNDELAAAYHRFKTTIEGLLPGTFSPEDLRTPGPSAEELEAKVLEQVSAIRGMLVVCGPSGVGKGTLIGRLMSEHGDKFGFSVSHTTRGPRPGEQDGVHYHFTNRESMQRGVNAGLFLEYADVHGNMYGTSLEAVAAVGQSGRIAVLDIDVQGATKIKASRAASKARFVFVDPPSLE
ncbi:hypothetical protein VaNZ11_012561, partial [Volvox africanus]